MIPAMGVPVLKIEQQLPPANLAERHDMLRTIMEWIADRFADAPQVDDSIAWEDGEEHDEPAGPSTL
jgi:hypothetical protein